MLVVVLLAESYAPVAEEFFSGQDDEFPAQVSFLKFMKFESSDLGKKNSAIFHKLSSLYHNRTAHFVNRTAQIRHLWLKWLCIKLHIVEFFSSFLYIYLSVVSSYCKPVSSVLEFCDRPTCYDLVITTS